MKTTNIYVLIDPRTKEVRYVGKANNVSQRYKAHLNRARKHQIHKKNWIDLLRKEKLKPIIEVIDEVLINEWQFWETYWICQMKCWGFDLINYTLGGDGCTFGNQTSFKKGHGGRRVVCIDENGIFIKAFDSVLSAEASIKRRGVDSVISGKTKTCGGLIWLYEEKYLTLSDEEIKKIVLDSKKRESSGSVSIFKKGNIPWNKDKKGYNINKGKIVLKFDLNKNMLQRFNNLQDAANSVSFYLNGKQKKGNPDLISVAIRKKDGIYKGFVWKFE